MIEIPKSPGLTQGTIFTCACAEDYPGQEVYGIIITARCDLAQGKAPVINYLPVVPLSSWLLNDGLLLLKDRFLREIEGKIKNCIRDLGWKDSIFDQIDLSQIIDAACRDENPKKKGTINRLRELSAQISEMDKLCAKSQSLTIADITRQNENRADAILRDLVQNKLADAHYLEKIDDSKKVSFVVLLREIQSLPPTIVDALIRGVDHFGFVEIAKSNPRFSGKLSISRDDFAMPVSVLQSPFIEFLMQRLTFLFSRIGVPDNRIAKISDLAS